MTEFVGAGLDAFTGQRHPKGARPAGGEHLGEGSQPLEGHGEHDIVNLAECARQFRSEGKGIGKRRLGEMAAIASVALERCEVGAVVAPEAGGPTVTRQEYGQPRAPGPGT